MIDEKAIAVLRERKIPNADMPVDDMLDTLVKLWRVFHAANKLGHAVLKLRRESDIDGLLWELGEVLAPLQNHELDGLE